MSHRARFKRYPTAIMVAGMALSGALFAACPVAAEAAFVSALAHSNWPDGRGRDKLEGRVDGVRMADADCSAAAAEAAAQTGGQVLSVSSRDDGGRTVCVVTVLVPGEDGQRPRKRTLTLPQ